MPTPKKNGRNNSKPARRNNELTRAKRILHAQLPALRERYAVTSLGVFGSYVRGEQKKRSDLDVLVEFERAPSLFKYGELEDHLSDLVGIKVDLVMKKTLKPYIGRNILAEVVSL
ncbi:MAG: nucleotidyltransferase family protein [Chloroflexi bacterium]|nr:nucleotidyltransferase family protein [Chloroflexota bacterium]